MFVKQISVFLENKPGKLAQVTDILEKTTLTSVQYQSLILRNLEFFV